MELNLELKRRVGGPHKHDALRASHIVECPDGQVRYVSSVFEYFEKRYTIITSFLEQPYTYPDDADFHIMLVVKARGKKAKRRRRGSGSTWRCNRAISALRMPHFAGMNYGK